MGSRVLLRETLVLGRRGEPGGRLRTATHATAVAHARPLLHEGRDLDGPGAEARRVGDAPHRPGLGDGEAAGSGARAVR